MGAPCSNEIPLLLSLFYSFRGTEMWVHLKAEVTYRLVLRSLQTLLADLFGRHSLVGSLAGAEHLYKVSAGVLRHA